jgi:ligand-binding sensor domain-containing protein/serine phosphatase RsbU (regulator of sigma subunit)
MNTKERTVSLSIRYCMAGNFPEKTFHTETCRFTRKGFLILFSLILSCHAFSQSYNIRNFDSEASLNNSYVYSIIQDSGGYLWIGTDKGLLRYNGFTFENFPLSDSLTSSFITCTIDEDGYPWFGTYDGGLSYFDGEKVQTLNMTDTDPATLTSFGESPDSAVWASTYSGGLMKLSKDSGILKYFRFEGQAVITSFGFLGKNELLVGSTSGLLLCRLKEAPEIEIVRYIPEIPYSRITCIQKLRDNSGFYVATENDGLFRLATEASGYSVSKIEVDHNADFSGIQYMYEDSRANLWLCSFGSGLIRLGYSAPGQFNSIHYFNKSSGYPADNVKTVYEDREGNIWSGNYGHGLTLITPRIFSIYPVGNASFGNSIISVCFDRTNRWLGTENGLIRMDLQTNKIIKFYGTGSVLPKDNITALYSADGRGLWIGTMGNGLFHMDTENEIIIKYPVATGKLENSITAITGNREHIWIGTHKGLLEIDSGTQENTWYTISQGGLPHNFINCLFCDRRGRLWVTTPGSIVSYIQDGKVFRLPLNSSEGNLTLGPVAEDSDSLIWVGSLGNGVFLLEADSIVNLTVKEGLLSDYCYSMISDDRDNIWIGHKTGLSRIRMTDYSIKPLSHIEGLPDNPEFNANATAEDKTGKIWFGTDKGLVSYDCSMESQRGLPPILNITSIKINGQETSIADKITLPAGNYKITIDFLGVSLREPDLVNYQYRLEGYDQWSEITKYPSITYNHLTQGDYNFILKAASGDGAVTLNPAIINIRIKRPIWENWWFYLSIVLLFIAFIYIYIKRREYRFLTEKRVLEEKVKERTFEIEFQKNEIQIQKDKIDEQNARITASISYASNIQNALLPGVQTLDRLLPDNFLLSLPKDIVSGDFYWLSERGGKVLLTVADCTGHGVPGAFMSLLGITFLNEIVNDQGITKSDEIVTELRRKLTRSLENRKDISSSDGMDLVLCVIDRNHKTIQYTGAMNDLIYIRNGNLSLIKADKISVCSFLDNSIPFTMKEINYREGDIFYLCSDGYADQFGGEFDKKFLSIKLHLTLLEIHKLSMASQKEFLENELINWKKDRIQTDDITVMGVRL